MKFQKCCLHCGRPNQSINYICNCNRQNWMHEYRALDVKISWNEAERQKTVRSFHQYGFDDTNGMLQYAAIPFREQMPTALEPVGITPLHHLKNLDAVYNCRVFIKNEGYNPSGCFKDRETVTCLLNSLRNNLRHAVIYSSGNAAASAAIFAQKLDFHLVTFVAGDTYPEKVDFIRQHGSDVVVIGDENTSFETGFRLFAQINADGIFAGRSYDNWSVRNPYRVQGDKTTSLEIVKQLSENGKIEVPDFVISPTANGSCLAGMWKGFREMKELGIIENTPKMVSCGIENANPVYKAVKQKQTERPVRCDLSKVDPEDAHIGSIILAEEGYDSMEAAKAVLESDGTAVEVHKAGIERSLYEFLQKEKSTAIEHGILPEPASVISLAAIRKLKENGKLKPESKVVSLISGHGMKAVGQMEELLKGKAGLQETVNEIIRQKQKEMIPKAKKAARRVNVEASYEAVSEAFMNLQ